MNVSGSPLKALGGDECLRQSVSSRQEGTAKAAGARLMLYGRTHMLLHTQHSQDTHVHFCLSLNGQKKKKKSDVRKGKFQWIIDLKDSD